MHTYITDYPEFEEVIKNGEIVYLFGTGISSALTGKPYGWWKWINDGINCLVDDTQRLELSDELQKDDSTDNLITVAGKVMRYAKAGGTYDKWMRSSFESNSLTNAALAGILKQLLIRNDVMATTNYDSLLEEATGLKSYTYKDVGNVFTMLDKRESNHILHLHGLYDSKQGIDNIIADAEQYQDILTDKGAQFVQNILGTKTLIFVGCGQTTEDANIAQFIQFAKQHLKIEKTYYFLYKKGQNFTNMPGNIIMIPYGDKYEDLQEFLNELAQIRVRTYMLGNALVGRNAYVKEKINIDGLAGYHFAQESNPFVGRLAELAKLNTFLNSDVQISWWAITGQAGVGKSRLALELIKSNMVEWFGFFMNKAATVADIENYKPFKNTIVIIDYVKGKEKEIVEFLQCLTKIYSNTGYKLRILILERENNAQAGTWYETLTQCFARADKTIFTSNRYQNDKDDYFLALEDMLDEDVESLIGKICQRYGLPKDNARDKDLRISYHNKFEQLKYRPLFVELYVEAWINNKCSEPRFDCYDELLRNIMDREQAYWLTLCDNDKKVCSAWIMLILRAICLGSINTSDLTGKYQNAWNIIKIFNSENSLPGKQRQESLETYIASMCQSLNNTALVIEPMYPDIIKEYMFLYYSDDEERLALANELLIVNPKPFSRFLAKAINDFPHNQALLNIFDKCTDKETSPELLLARLSLLNQSVIHNKDDAEMLLQTVKREYEFWHGLDYVVEDDTIAAIKCKGLFLIARHYGGWAPFLLENMLQVIEEALAVKGGIATSGLKLVIVPDIINQLSITGYTDVADRLQDMLGKQESSCEDIIDDLGFGKTLLLQKKNREMMELLKCFELYDAYEVLKSMVKVCSIDEIAEVSCTTLACRSMAWIAGMAGSTKYIDRALCLITPYFEKYTTDSKVISHYFSVRLLKLQTEYFLLSDKEKIDKNSEYLVRVRKIEDEISQYTLDYNISEAIGLAKCFNINLMLSDAVSLKEQIRELEEILDILPNADSIAQAYISSVSALYKDVLKQQIPKAEVDKAYAYMLRTTDSESLRTVFYDLLGQSTEAANRANYMHQHVIDAAQHDYLYNPMNCSGIDEIDSQGFDDTIFDEQGPYRREGKKIGRNDKCPCGSGKKFKKCCMEKWLYD